MTDHPEELGREEWQGFLRDQDDRIITLHGPVVIGLTKFKRTVYIGLAIFAIGLLAALWGIRQQGLQADKNLKTLCVDQRGNRAQRHQWERIAELIERSNLKPNNPRYLRPREAGKLFAKSYQDALREAGPPPPCPVPPPPE